MSENEKGSIDENTNTIDDNLDIIDESLNSTFDEGHTPESSLKENDALENISDVTEENLTNESDDKFPILLKLMNLFGIHKNVAVENETDVDTASIDHNINKKRLIYKNLRILFILGFIIFTGLFINEVWLEPHRINKSIEKVQDLYKIPDPTNTPTPEPVGGNDPTADPAEEDQTKEVGKEPSPTPDPNRDSMGRLLQFKPLLDENADFKGWITIPETNIDYPVLQSSNGDPSYYLTRDWDGNYLKAGSLYLDEYSSVEKGTQALLIHGHNMTSTDNMFHYLLKYKKLDYYKKRPVFRFDTIYNTGEWKIFAYIITNGTSKKEPFFNYRRAEFKSDSDFLNFIYQLRIRSIYNMDTVDVNEDDEILLLSTCSYEVKDYRTVIVARKIREGEDPTVDVDSVTENPDPLYPGSYYYRYGGKAPKLPATFEEALKEGLIGWYKTAGPESDAGGNIPVEN